MWISRSGAFALVSLAVLGCGKDSSGPSPITHFGCDDAQTYTVGTSISGSLGSSDCFDPDGVAFADYYEFRQTEWGPVSFQLEASTDAIIGLADEREEFLDVQASMAGEPAVLSTMLPPGSYVLVVSGSFAAQPSSYSLSSRRSMLMCAAARSHTVGTSVTGTLAASDCRTTYGRLLDRHDFTVVTTRDVTIEMDSDAFDTFLYLFSENGIIIAENDDRTDGSLNSALTVTLPPGTYSIGATTYSGGQWGEYSLSTR